MKKQRAEFSFTMARLESLKAPATGRVYYYDTKSPGLAMCVTAGGVKTWYRTGRIEGKYTRVRIGSFPQVALQQARDAAALISGEVAVGKNPHAEKVAKRQSKTVDEVYQLVLVDLKERNSQWETRDKNFQRGVMPTFGSRKIASIKADDIERWLKKLGKKKGHGSANLSLILLQQCFRKSLKLGLIAKNEAADIKRLPQDERERFLLPEEMQRFFAALDKVSDTFRDACKLSLFTGARRSNVLGMRWRDLSLDSRTWIVPACDSKNGRAMAITLPDEAIEILRQRLENQLHDIWVFPAKSKSGHAVQPSRAWEKIMKSSGLKDLRFHDLRRTLGSWQAAEGASLQIIGKSLGHSSTRSTRIYARLQLDPVRKSVSAAAKAINEAVKKPSAENS